MGRRVDMARYFRVGLRPAPPEKRAAVGMADTGLCCHHPMVEPIRRPAVVR
jgi:hypothetical protein